MRAQASGVAERGPRRLGRNGPAVISRRGELAAALATAVLVAELVLAPFTVVLTGGLTAVGRLGRWRAHWLAGPAVAAVGWILMTGPADAAAGYAAWPRWLAARLARLAGHRPDLLAAGAAGRAAQPASAGGILTLLAHQLPIALAVAVGQAAFALWLGWRSHGTAGPVQWRPGLIAYMRRRWNTATLAAGHAVTRDGWALGVQTDTGSLVGLSWPEAAHGVLLTGKNGDALGQLALTAVSAAIRRRKTVLIVDLAGSAGPVSKLAGSLGVPMSTVHVSTAPASAEPMSTVHVSAVHVSAVPVSAVPVSAVPVSAVPVSAVPVAGSAEQHDQVAASFGLAIRRRGIVLVPVSSTVAGPVIADLLAVLASLRDLQLRGDSVVWVSGCEHIGPSLLAELIELAVATGTAVLLSSTNAASVSELAGVIVDVRADGRFAVTRSGGRGSSTNCRLVPSTGAGGS